MNNENRDPAMATVTRTSPAAVNFDAFEMKFRPSGWREPNGGLFNNGRYVRRFANITRSPACFASTPVPRGGV